ncbi:MAG: hypothetical protein HC769_12925 [Cyanobacteria bacterium CRU_2_1]|nr:hypothetical protein [Cyanobacteria bacterium CRU_2_1]
MVSIPSSNFVPTYSAATLCRIVGFVCLAGFIVDILALGLPPRPFDLAWRLGLLQQLGSRSIILLFGAALVIYGSMESRRLLKQLALACLVIGIVFHVSCIFMIRDISVFRQQAISTIDNQVNQIQTQIQQGQTAPEAANLTPEQLQQASQVISTQAEAFRQNTQATIVRTAFASIGNLVITGLGLIGLGRFSMRLGKG